MLMALMGTNQHCITTCMQQLQPPVCVRQAPAKQENVLREAALLAIPTVFDLAATVLMNVGLLSVTASVYQMVRLLG